MPGRKRNTDPNLYSTKELALATNIGPRNVILLCEREDLSTVSGGGGPGQHRLLDITGFAKTVVIGAFADAGLPLSEGVKIANAFSSYRARRLPQDLANYMSKKWLPLDKIQDDIFAIIFNGRHLIFRTENRAIRSFPNYNSGQLNQPLGRYYVEPQIAGSSSFLDKKEFFDYLVENARVQVKVNISQALRRAALQMQRVKVG